MARILVIDDSPTIVATVTTLLSADGHDVQTLASFVDLPQVLRAAPPALIILDLNMPLMPGESFGRFVKKHELRATPILIYSAAEPERLLQAGRELGAATLSKNRAGDLRRVVSLTLAQGGARLTAAAR